MKAINVGIIGFGTVGSGVVKILQKDATLLEQKCMRPLVLKTVADLKFENTQDDSCGFKKTRDAYEIINDPDIDIVIELVGGVSPAIDFIQSALKQKKHVVTANKELIAKHGAKLFTIAKENKVNLFIEASTGGGIPIINAMTCSLAANSFLKVFGILNGTTNYILSKMRNDGAAFAEVLEEAQKLGYAEADPSSDVDGHDIAYKLCILASITFDNNFDINDIYTEGMRNISKRDIDIANEYGFVIKMLAIGVSHGDKVELRVHPAMIPKKHPLASVEDSFNAVFIEGENVGQAMFLGRGAGELPTASAVMGDVISIARDFEAGQTNPCLNWGHTPCSVLPMGEVKSSYYLRFLVKDESGVLAQISKICGENDVSIRLVKQVDSGEGKAELNIMTHCVIENKLQKAVELIKKLDTVEEVCSVIRMEL